MKYIYLASPYSHADSSVRETRWRQAVAKAAQYANKKIAVFSPIAHTHHMADFMEESKRMDFDLWMAMDLPLLKDASELHVLCLDGWRCSRGVTREIEYANQIGIPVKQVYMDIEP